LQTRDYLGRQQFARGVGDDEGHDHDRGNEGRPPLGPRGLFEIVFQEVLGSVRHLADTLPGRPAKEAGQSRASGIDVESDKQAGPAVEAGALF
jgi:hypothetical protein